MKTLRGDLLAYALNGRLPVIVHGCNCFCNFGAGIAKQVKNTFPEAFDADKRTVAGNKNKLGTLSITQVVRGSRGITIVNAYTQYRYGGGVVNADYDAIDKCFQQIRDEFGGLNMAIGYPLIGCGLAGGDWSIVRPIIDENLKGLDHYLVVK